MTTGEHKVPRLKVAAMIFFIVSLPFIFIHLTAAPDDAPISPLQHAVAALANFFGPWGVAIVRLVDFPNAGMRAFHACSAVGLTLLGLLLLFGLFWTRKHGWRILLTLTWSIFVLAWFGVGLLQIASGLL